MQEIHKNGYWSAETAHLHHVHSPKLAQWLIKWVKGKVDGEMNTPIYDFGAGLGDYLKAFQESGFTTLMGYEGEPPTKKSFPHIRQQDLTIPFTTDSKGVCLFLEVAEHIPAKQCEIAIQNVLNACDKYLVLSWAVRGQPGFGHVNCLNNDEVIHKIEAFGFKYLEQDSIDARNNVDDFASWFRNTIMIFERV